MVENNSGHFSLPDEISFEILTSPSCLIGRPYYVFADHSFGFLMDTGQEERYGKEGTTSFAIDTLQLEVSIESLFCLYPSGYCPLGLWERVSLSPPISNQGSLRANYKNILHPAIAVSIEDMIAPTPWFDPSSGWFCMGRLEPPEGTVAVEFATGCLGVVINKKLNSLWIKPENWKEIAKIFNENQ